MDITRRTFIKGAAIVPLVTIPGLASAEPLPKSTDVLMAGADIGRPAHMTELDVRVMIVESIDEARKYQDGGSDVHWMSNNLMEWVCEHAIVEDAVFAGIGMLWAYDLAIAPNQLPAFENYHRKVGEYVLADVGDSGSQLDRIRVEMYDLVNAHPKLVMPEDFERHMQKHIEDIAERVAEKEYWANRTIGKTVGYQSDGEWRWIKGS